MQLWCHKATFSKSSSSAMSSVGTPFWDLPDSAFGCFWNGDARHVGHRDVAKACWQRSPHRRPVASNMFITHGQMEALKQPDKFTNATRNSRAFHLCSEPAPKKWKRPMGPSRLRLEKRNKIHRAYSRTHGGLPGPIAWLDPGSSCSCRARSCPGEVQRNYLMTLCNMMQLCTQAHMRYVSISLI